MTLKLLKWDDHFLHWGSREWSSLFGSLTGTGCNTWNHVPVFVAPLYGNSILHRSKEIYLFNDKWLISRSLKISIDKSQYIFENYFEGKNNLIYNYEEGVINKVLSWGGSFVFFSFLTSNYLFNQEEKLPVSDGV